MIISIDKPEILAIQTTRGRTSFGGDQEWYTDVWQRRSGCGPTSAANLTAYLAHRDIRFRPLYHHGTFDRTEDWHPVHPISHTQFISHMEDVFTYVTPGPMGLNHISMFTDGIRRFATSRHVPLHIEAFEVNGLRKRTRNATDLTHFIKKGLSLDCPLAFLALSRGRERRLQNWHWVTITSVDIQSDRIIATASDEGDLKRFDLRRWYETTNLHGGLVYLH